MTWIATSVEDRRAQFGTYLLGTGGLGGTPLAAAPNDRQSQSLGFAYIDRGIGEGIKILDTADVYTGGNSERVIGTWAREHPSEEVLIQTKTGATGHGPNLSPERIKLQLQHSVAQLGRVDLFLAHRVDPNTPWSDSLSVFSDAVESGLIRAYGLSNVDGGSLTAALEAADKHGLVRPEVIQNSFSLLVRGDEKDVLPIAESEGLAYTPYSPLAFGVLTGRYSDGEAPAEGSRARGAAGALEFLHNSEVMDKVRHFDLIAARRGVSSAGLALAWLINHPLVTAPIVAPSRDSHWDSVREAARIEWTVPLSDELDALFAAA